MQIAHEDIMEKNYSITIEKTRKVLGTWYNRNLSLIGRIQVVNTLVASLYVYKMMVLPTMTKSMFKKIDNLIRDYIWKGKKSKIAYNVLQLSKKEGGLNLVNLSKRDKALKATWPSILHREEDYATIVYNIMRVSGLHHDIWRCNLSPEDVQGMKIKSEFWKDVLSSWCEFNYHSPKREDNQILWYNSRIRIANKPFYWKDIHQNGLMYVHQLFENSRLKSSEQMKRQYGVSILRFNGIKAALPREWQGILYV